MKIWIDAQLSPAIATWIGKTFGITALALRDIALLNSSKFKKINSKLGYD